MLAPASFAIHVTYTCPLTCAHCCFGSSPQNRDGLDPAFILAAIDHIPDDIKMVAFTGGEPFLHHSLAKYIHAAKTRGFVTRVVTSAYFGKTKDLAHRRLNPVVEAGLDQLSISWDDYHEEFVDFACVRNVAEVAVELGVSTAINSVQTVNSRWTRNRIVEELGATADKLVSVHESHLNLTGRAEAELNDETFRDRGYLGPCPYVLTGPTLSGKGKLLACCGVIPDTPRLTLSDNFQVGDIPNLIQNGLNNPLLLWLFLRGPFALLEEIESRRNVPIPGKDSVGGNCEACKILLTGKAFEPLIDDVLQEKIVEIAGELQLLESLGWLAADSVVKLWLDNSITRVGL